MIVLSTVVAKDANHRFPVIVVEEKRSDRRQSGSFFVAGNVGLCSEIVGGARMEIWAQNSATRRPAFLWSFGSERGPGFHKDGPGHPGCRPSLSPAWRISPGCPWIDNFRGFGNPFRQHFFCCSCMDYSFRLLLLSCPCVDLDKHSVSLQVYRNSLYKRNWHLFRPRPQLFAFCLTLWHPFFTPRWQPCALREYTKLRYTYACKSRASKQLTPASTSVPVLCDSSTESACMVLFFANHGTSSF